MLKRIGVIEAAPPRIIGWLFYVGYYELVSCYIVSILFTIYINN